MNKNLIFNSLAIGISALCRILSVLYISRVASPEILGEAIFAFWFIEFVYLVSSFGLPAFGTRFFYAQKKDLNFNNKENFYFSYAILTSIISGLLFGFFLPTAETESSKILMLLWASLYCFLSLMNARLQGKTSYKHLFISNAVSSLSLPLLIFSSKIFKISINIISISYLIPFLICCLYFYYNEQLNAKRFDIRFERNFFEQHIKYTFNMWLVSLITILVWGRGELLILNKYLSFSEIAIYGVCLTASSGISFVVNFFTSFLTPIYSQVIDSASREALLFKTIKFHTKILNLVLIFLTFGIFFSDKAILNLFGPFYSNYSLVFDILILATLSLVSSPYNLLIQLKSKAQFNRNLNIFSIAFFVILNYFLIKKYQIIGAAFARAISLIFISLTILIVTRRVVGRSFFPLKEIVLSHLLAIYLLAEKILLNTSLIHNKLFLFFISILILLYLVLDLILEYKRMHLISMAALSS